MASDGVLVKGVRQGRLFLGLCWGWECPLAGILLSMPTRYLYHPWHEE